MTNGVRCKQCGTRDVEEPRECYATPVCYACLPPPRPLPIRCNCDLPGIGFAAECIGTFCPCRCHDA